MASWDLVLPGVLASVVLSCAPPQPVLTPAPAPPAVCPIDGCAAPARARVPSAVLACAVANESRCGGIAAHECTERALAAWGEAQDEHAVACVAGTLDEACSLGDAHACAFVGRLWLDGRGVARDVGRGIAALVRACDGGVALACVVGVRWSSQPLNARELPDASQLRARLAAEHACLSGESGSCADVGLLFYYGRNGFPRDRSLAARAYERGCELGAALACNNLGDALAYADGVERDVVRSVAMFDRACRTGEAMGCANLGYMFEHGEGVTRDRGRARELYRDACARGDVYGCLHAEMLARQDAGAPRDSERALAFWQRACALADARACAFVGVIYEDGPDGMKRDVEKSLEAMNRACGMGDERACEWMKAHRAD